MSADCDNHGVYEMTSRSEAIETIVRTTRRNQPLELPLQKVRGLVLAETIVSPIDIPNADVSTMDGYAIRASDSEPATKNGQASIAEFKGISTGQALPSNCDAVVPVELADTDQSVLTVGRCFEPNDNVRAKGASLSVGTVAIEKDAILGSVEIGILSSLGISQVSVVPSPRVAVLVTGDELRQPGDTLGPGDTFDCNSSLIEHRLADYGATMVRLDRLPDNDASIADWLRTVAGDVDLIVTSGGASVGERDWVSRLLSELGTLAISRVAMKPGMPFRFGTIDQTPICSLPGNPASALACLHSFVWPAVRAIAGKVVVEPAAFAQLDSDVDAPSNRDFLCPVVVNQNLATPLPTTFSATLVNHSGTDCYALIPAGGATAGSQVRIEQMS